MSLWDQQNDDKNPASHVDGSDRFATILKPDGSLVLATVAIEELETWISRATQRTYANRWHVTITIFWAKEFGAYVTAVTIAPSHIKLVEDFAAKAGVEAHVLPLLCDALTVPGESCFDAAVAIDSSSAFPRDRWFRRLAKLLRPEGRVFIFDCFLERSEYEEPFNHHWCAQIGTIDEYLATAREANFKPSSIEDVSVRAVDFWTTTLALIEAEAQSANAGSIESLRARESYRMHSLMRRGLLDGGLRHILMSFTKE
jgi:tocopherol O-methyltransferase